MQILEQFYTIVVVTCLLLVMSMKDILTNRLLKWVLVLLLYSESIRIIVETGAGTTPMYIIMSGYIARSLFIPGAYLYLRNYFNKRHVERTDVVNLVPCALFCMGCTIAFLINGNLDFLQNNGRNIFSSFSAEQISLLAFRLYVYCMTGFYLWLVLVMLRKNYLGIEKEKVTINGTVNGLVNGNGMNGNGMNGNGMNGNGHAHEAKKHGEVSSFFLTEEKMKHIDSVVTAFLTEKKSFLQHGYSLKHLAEETNVPLHILSAFINRYHKMNFNDFINEYRVSHCKVKIMAMEWKYKKLEAIADESGFSNRNTFTSAFKKATGLNPSAYLKQLKADQEQEELLLDMSEGPGIHLKKVRDEDV
jgi:AraC-like DNA-binding protein